MRNELETGGLIVKREATLVEDAVNAFLSDVRARGLRESSIYKLKLLTTRLKEFGESKESDSNETA
jgi:hypothetical protein